MAKNRVRGLLTLAVVHGHGEDFPDPLVHPRLAGADVPDALQQLVEMVGRTGVALEPLVVQHEPLDQVLGQPGGGPLPELGAAGGANAIADGQDGFQAVVVHVAAHAASAFDLNYSEFPKSSFRFNLTAGVDCCQVFIDRRYRDFVKIGQLPLGQQTVSPVIKTRTPSPAG